MKISERARRIVTKATRKPDRLKTENKHKKGKHTRNRFEGYCTYCLKAVAEYAGFIDSREVVCKDCYAEIQKPENQITVYTDMDGRETYYNGLGERLTSI